MSETKKHISVKITKLVWTLTSLHILLIIHWIFVIYNHTNASIVKPLKPIYWCFFHYKYMLCNKVISTRNMIIQNAIWYYFFNILNTNISTNLNKIRTKFIQVTILGQSSKSLTHGNNHFCKTHSKHTKYKALHYSVK